MKPRCSWCNRELGEDHGYSRDNLPVCASYSNPPSREYNRCKAAKSRNKTPSSQPERPEGHSTLHDGIQIMIDQLQELISLQKQALSQPRQLVKEETIKTIQVTKEFSTPDFGEDDDLGIEIKRDTSTNSVQNFLKSMDAIQGFSKPREERKQ